MKYDLIGFDLDAAGKLLESYASKPKSNVKCIYRWNIVGLFNYFISCRLIKETFHVNWTKKLLYVWYGGQ